MRIQSNSSRTRSYRTYRINGGQLTQNLEKLSSGFKINRSADDAAGLAISEKMRRQISGLDTAQENVKDGMGLVQVTEGALEEYHDILNRMLDISEESANSTVDDKVDRKQLQKEMNHLSRELDRIADSANFNGIYTLSDGLSAPGTPAPTVPAPPPPEIVLQIGDTADKSNQIKVPCFDMHTDSVGLSGADVSTQDKALDTIAKVRNTINHVSDVRGTYGTLHNRLEHALNYLGSAERNMQSSESTLRDADMAQERMQYVKNNIFQQSTQSMMAQANMIPEDALRLMQG